MATRRNSPFAAALVEHLPKPGLDLRRAFGFVRDDVLKNTGNKQEPYVYGSLGGNDVPLVPVKPVATGPQADPQAAVRRDYELALQLATRDAWEAFLSQYPDGFYANLAKGQLKKIAAEETRLTASEKAQQAEQEKARLAADGARQAEQAKAAAAAKKAEEARIAAEKAKQIEQEKAAAAEWARQAEQEKVRLATEKAKQAEQEKAVAAEQMRLAAEKAASEKKQLAAVSPADKPEQPAVDLPRALQAEFVASAATPARRRQLERGVAEGARSLQQARGHEARREDRQRRRARRPQRQDRPHLSADLRDRLSGRWRSLCEDHLPGWLPRQRRQ